MKKTKIIATMLMASLMFSFACSDDDVKEETEYVNPQGVVVHQPSTMICWFPYFYGYHSRTVYVHQTVVGSRTTVVRSYSPPARSSYSSSSSSTSRGGWGGSSYSSGS